MPTDAAEPAATRLADHAPPPFLVDEMDLDFELGEERTLVRAKLKMRRNPAAVAAASAPAAASGSATTSAPAAAPGSATTPASAATPGSATTPAPAATPGSTATPASTAVPASAASASTAPPPADPVLDGRGLDTRSVRIDGEAVSRHECRINPETGALQVYAPRTDLPALDVPPPAFRALKDRELTRARGAARHGGRGACGPRRSGARTPCRPGCPWKPVRALFLHLAGETYGTARPGARGTGGAGPAGPAGRGAPRDSGTNAARGAQSHGGSERISTMNPAIPIAFEPDTITFRPCQGHDHQGIIEDVPGPVPRGPAPPQEWTADRPETEGGHPVSIERENEHDH